MAVMQETQVSPPQLEANRRNALASTGPRTEAGKRRSRLNALVHGRYARTVPKALWALGEDPREYEALLQELLEAHQPRNSSERMLVEDIASLRWQRRRAERAQTAKQARALEALEFERRRQAIEMRRTDAPVPFVTLKLGVRTLKNSPGKFRMLLSYLETLFASAESRQFPAGGKDMLRTIYGVAPAATGIEIISLWEQLAKSKPTSPDDLRALIFCTKLRREIECVKEEFELYKAEHVELSETKRDAALAPAGADWRLMLRQMNSIDRQIERKTRLLLTLQRPRPARKRPRVGRPEQSKKRGRG
jgi:hypothetical protein